LHLGQKVASRNPESGCNACPAGRDIANQLVVLRACRPKKDGAGITLERLRNISEVDRLLVDLQFMRIETVDKSTQPKSLKIVRRLARSEISALGYVHLTVLLARD
jgi:hypothetical protein